MRQKNRENRGNEAEKERECKNYNIMKGKQKIPEREPQRELAERT